MIQEDGVTTSAAERADNLIESINTRVDEIKRTLRGLDAEKVAIQKEADKQMADIDIRIGRLNSFLTRMGGGAVDLGASSRASTNGKSRPARMTAESLKRAKASTMELAGKHGSDGLRRADLVDSLGISATQATKVLMMLVEEKRLRAVGEKAGRRYLLADS